MNEEMSPLLAQYLIGCGIAMSLTFVAWGISFIISASVFQKNLMKLGQFFDWVRGSIEAYEKRSFRSRFLEALLQVSVHVLGSWLSVSLLTYELIVQAWNWKFCPAPIKEARSKIFNNDLSKEEALSTLLQIHDYHSLGKSVEALKDQKPLKNSNNWFIFYSKRKSNSQGAA